MHMPGRRWLPLAVAGSASLALWAIAAVYGYAWQTIWLPAAITGAAWPNNRKATLHHCRARLRNRSVGKQ